MRWHKSHRFAPQAVAVADRHYSRQSPGTPQFMRSGRCLVLLTKAATALWGASWSYPEMVKHAWADCWECTHFRNEAPALHLSSELIVEAVAATRWYWGDPPSQGFITTVNASKVQSRNPGYCFLKAGWTKLPERTNSGLIVYQLLPLDMPEPEPFLGATLRLW